MSTTKKPVATLAKKEETKAAPVAAKVEVKEEVKAVETKAVATEAKETAKKAPAKKETAKKAPAKKATAAKKETAAKTTKATTAKAAKEVKIAIQFADKSYTSEDLANIANDVWVYDYNKKASELKNVQLYVKPEESKVYYVFNDEITGDFNI